MEEHLNDELNEEFGPQTWNISSLEFLIYNEWGEPIFETDELDTSWDGFYKGELVPSGAYAYIINYTYFSQGETTTETISGTVTILR